MRLGEIILAIITFILVALVVAGVEVKCGPHRCTAMAEAR